MAWLPALAWMALIFTLSHDADSGQRSGWLLEVLASAWSWFTGRAPDPAGLHALHLGVRKSAHLCEFGILYLLIRRAGPRPTGALALSFVYAVLDEWHQTFVTSRVGSPADVVIDGLGALTAAGLERLGRGRAWGVEPGEVLPEGHEVRPARDCGWRSRPPDPSRSWRMR